MSTHRCPGPGRELRVPADMLACRAHWFQVPKVIRGEVWSAWRRLGMAPPAEVVAAEERHGLAMRKAIETMRPL